MSTSTAEMVNELKQLPADAKLEIIGELWDSMTEEEVPTPDDVLEELERRLDAYECNPERGTTWEEAERQIRAKLGYAR
jgi:putative addiction module component (TIGR02574 family)